MNSLPPSALTLLLGVLVFGPPRSGVAQQVSDPGSGGAPTSVDSLSVFRGRVVDHETGEALYGAAVSLAAGPGGTPGLGTRVTNQDGRFLFRPVPPGTYNLTVTLLGYRTLREPLLVEVQTDLEVVLKLAVSPVELDPIEVVVEQQIRGPLADFERRRQLGMGTYFTREDIEARNPYVITDLLRTVPGVRVMPAGQFGEQAIRLRGNCRPEIIVDGIRTSIDTDVDHVLPPMDVEAVEVYKGPELPVQFGNNSCGAVVFWTRVPEDTGGHGITWTRIGITAGFILLAFLGIR
ncbi:MAG: carboxypeptidase regulatory-like domain-containing protein [Longimicrobiales bacterium]